MRLEQVLPWGRSLKEYREMFGLTQAELDLHILDCAGGPASFNAEMTALGKRVVSCDPVYQFSAEQIAQRIDEAVPHIVKSVEANREKFVWTGIDTLDELLRIRLTAMQTFLADFPQGLLAGRYRQEALPQLPFPDRAFDLAISSHLLFTYSEHLSLDFHIAAIAEMCRLAPDVRIFPLLMNMTGERSPYVDPVIEHFQAIGYTLQIQTVPYEFQRGGNQILRLLSATEENS
ncbi:MAG: SAM-dependent methyltransferase [Alkalinema sp. CACIAM 70d]|nr:MAG: SAM-dependent methyltransferase [Alkalinema sp. CACIAM 70d]